MQYNTDKDKIRIRMYGRNVQNLLAQAHHIADREERSDISNACVQSFDL